MRSKAITTIIICICSFMADTFNFAAGSPALAILGTGSDETYMIRIANL
jgi:hypothetical protein